MIIRYLSLWSVSFMCLIVSLSGFQRKYTRYCDKCIGVVVIVSMQQDYVVHWKTIVSINAPADTAFVDSSSFFIYLCQQ